MYRSNCLCCLELDNETIGDVAAAPIVELINEFAATVQCCGVLILQNQVRYNSCFVASNGLDSAQPTY